MKGRREGAEKREEDEENKSLRFGGKRVEQQTSRIRPYNFMYT